MRGLILSVIMGSLALSQAAAQDTTVIAAFGDSLFAGYGVAPADTFPARLEARLVQDGYHAKVINDGISGDTTAGGVARLDHVIAQKPDIVIVELGGNDMLRGLPAEDSRANLGAILSRLSAAGARLLVVGQKAPLSYGSRYTQQFDALFCDLAKTYHAPCYASYFEGIYANPDYMQADGIHPNAAGVNVVLEKLYPYVTSLMKK